MRLSRIPAILEHLGVSYPLNEERDGLAASINDLGFTMQCNCTEPNVCVHAQWSFYQR